MRKKKKKDKTLLWQLSAVAVFLILVSVGYQRFEQKLPTLTKTVKTVPRASNKPVVQAEAVVAPIAQMELLDTSDWQTYTSEYIYHEEVEHFDEGSYAYSFKYPPNWSILHNDLGNECERMDVTAPEGYGLTIARNCGEVTYVYRSLPSGSIDIKQYERVGQDGHTSHIVRIFNEDEMTYMYVNVGSYVEFTSDGEVASVEELLSNKSKYQTEVSFFDVPTPPGQFKIYTVGIDGVTPDQETLAVMDNTIYSFTSLKR